MTEGLQLSKVNLRTEEDAEENRLLCFVNSKSGGQNGKRVLERLKEYEGVSTEVFDLMSASGTGLTQVFEKYGSANVLVCGGDGTVSWIVGELMKIGRAQDFPMAILPLGTGNDLSRFLGYGANYSPRILSVTSLEKLARAKDKISFDIWELTVDWNDLQSEDKEWVPHALLETGENQRKGYFLNYFSFGTDADIVFQFHAERQRRPKTFRNPIRNKIEYLKKSMGPMLCCCCSSTASRSISGKVQLSVRYNADDEEFQSVELPANLKSLIFLNIRSFAGGFDVVGPKGEPQANDGAFEVVATTCLCLDIHRVVLCGKVCPCGGHLQRVAQCSESLLEIDDSCETFAQVDGEPFPHRTGGRVHIRKAAEQAWFLSRKQ